LLFESNGCVRTPLVIVTGPDRGLVGQGKQMLLDALIQRLRTAGLEVGPATPIDEKRVAGEDVIAPHETHAATRVTRRVQCLEGLGTTRQCVAVLKLDVGSRDAAIGGRGRLGTSELHQLSSAGDVIGVGMRLNRKSQVEVVRLQHLKVAIDLLFNRINDDGIARFGVHQDVGVGAGWGIEQLDGRSGCRFCHGFTPV